MNPDNFEPSQDENIPSLNDVLKTAEEHASIEADLQTADGTSSTLDSDVSQASGPLDEDLSTPGSPLLHPAKDETEAAWCAFLTFLDLAPKGVKNADVAKATGTSTSTIKYWSSRFKWRQRLQYPLVPRQDPFQPSQALRWRPWCPFPGFPGLHCRALYLQQRDF